MVTVCTSSLTFNNSPFCPHSIFMCFVWIWEQTAIISLYNINWLVFITDGVCLLRGTDWIVVWNLDRFLSSKRHSMSQAVSCRPLTAEERAQSQVSPCQICDGQSGSGTDFSSSTSVFPRQHHPINAPHSYSTLTLFLPEGPTGKARNLPKSNPLSEIGYRHTQQYFYFRCI